MRDWRLLKVVGRRPGEGSILWPPRELTGGQMDPDLPLREARFGLARPRRVAPGDELVFSERGVGRPFALLVWPPGAGGVP